MRRLLTTLPLAALLTACAGGAPPEPPEPPPLDPTGTYDCYLEVEGMELSAVLTITEGEEGYEGTMDTDMGLASLSDIVVEGDEVTFVVDAQGMIVYFAVAFEGDDFTGDFDVDGSPGYVSGTKR